ncbi:hypothetical protein E4U59_007019 [Claviceps monticola]|nr:hypothetical protein E4U59_007019 [Claviceps monticola]
MMAPSTRVSTEATETPESQINPEQEVPSQSESQRRGFEKENAPITAPSNPVPNTLGPAVPSALLADAADAADTTGEHLIKLFGNF